ncbi:MAG: metallophosphoesterase [Anaerolineae bacterium]|nr:metallophosphoesterase [Anaerolineae bacterium]
MTPTPLVEVDPLEHTPLHTLLVQSNRLQAVPVWAVGLVIILNGLIIAAAWLPRGTTAATITLVGYTAAILTNWVLLLFLPRTGRSYGPDRPSTLALSALFMLILGVLGGLNATPWIGVVILALLTALVYYSTWVEPFKLGVTQQTYTTAKWGNHAAPLRLLQIGDIHMERVTLRERALNQMVRDLQPDVIVFTGDFVNLSNTHDPEAEKAIREIIGQWQAPLGVYCISGTPLVEPLERVKAFVAGLDNLKLLPNEWATVETPGGALNILGLVVTHDMDKDRVLLQRMMSQSPDNGLHLLLMHPPDIAPEANSAGIDLYLCGHTHGGQMRLPGVGALFSSSHLGNRFIMGRYEFGTTTLYTARGVGLEGLGAPRARFFCPPEIVLWEIRGSQS